MRKELKLIWPVIDQLIEADFNNPAVATRLSQILSRNAMDVPKLANPGRGWNNHIGFLALRDDPNPTFPIYAGDVAVLNANGTGYVWITRFPLFEWKARQFSSLQRYWGLFLPLYTLAHVNMAAFRRIDLMWNQASSLSWMEEGELGRLSVENSSVEQMAG